MRRTIIGLGLAILTGCPGLAHAGAERAGTTAANFLSVGQGARILGMGGASLALGGGLDAVGWNTASLGFLDETEIVFSHAGLAAETSQEWLAAGGRVGASRVHWSFSGLYQTEGNFEGRDASNQSTGTFGISSLAVGAHLAHRIGEIAAVGLGGKWVQENLGVVRGTGVALDAGLLLRYRNLGFGLSAQNAAGSVSFGESGSFPLPANFGAGIAYELPQQGLRADLDVNFPNAYYTNVRGGIEWRWEERLALRAGYRAELGAPSDEALSGPSFGLGAGVHGLWFDYGFLVTQSGEGQHRMGLSFRPGRLNSGSGDPFGSKRSREFGDGRIGPPLPPVGGKTGAGEKAKRDSGS